MSRTRSRYEYTTPRCWDQIRTPDVYAGTINMYKGTSYPIVGTSRFYSGITDELTPVGEPRPVHPVQHNTRQGAEVTLESWVEYAPSPTKPLRCLLQYRLPMRHTAVLDYQLPAGNWSGLAGQLADQLNGRIDEGSLLGVSAVEAAKTIAMIRNPFNLLKPNWRKTAKASPAAVLSIKKASNIWLEHRYGWNALWQDIKAVAKTTRKLLDDAKPIDDGGGLDAITVKEEFTGIFPTWTYNPGDTESFWTAHKDDGLAQAGDHSYRVRLKSISSRGVYRVGCKQRVDAAIRWSRTKRLINAYGLDTSSIADVIWELVPFSFVVDWFVDPSGIWHSSSRNRLHQCDVKGLCSSLKIEGTWSADVLLIGNPYKEFPEWIYRSRTAVGPSYFPTVATCSHKGYERWVDVPDGSFSSAFADKDLTLIQRISGSALLVQKFL